MESKDIRFIDRQYNELFRIPDGGKIEITFESGEKSIKECKYIDDYHTKVGNYLFHICEFAEIMERNNSTYKAVDEKNLTKQGIKHVNNFADKKITIHKEPER